MEVEARKEVVLVSVAPRGSTPVGARKMDRLNDLESQSIFIFREAFARLKNIALLWSLGKDFERDDLAGAEGVLWTHSVSGHARRYRQEVPGDVRIPRALRQGMATRSSGRAMPASRSVDPTLPPAARSAARKTEGLKLALAKHGFDGLIAGIRRDEEPTRAKERVFSLRGVEGGWDVRDQPPEFWNHFNASPPRGAHMRVHPILHWTEADIWAYTRREDIPIISLYLARERQALPVARRCRHHVSGGIERQHDRRDHRRA